MSQMLRPNYFRGLLLGAAALALGTSATLHAKASQAGPGPAHSLVSEPALASKDGMKLTKLQYDDVYEEWTQKVEENDLRRSQLEVQEFELRKKCLREALSPENLMLAVRLERYPRYKVSVCHNDWGNTACEEVCKAIKKEGLPKWFELSVYKSKFYISFKPRK